jgi:hypothetical protein
MTTQVPDTLTVGGQTYRLETLPLEAYFDLHPERRPPFEAPDSSVWRGYVAEWAIQDGNLYVVKVSGWVTEASAPVEVGLESVFPDERNGDAPGVPATWFSGELRVAGDRGPVIAVKDGRVSDAEMDSLLGSLGTEPGNRARTSSAAEPDRRSD